MLFTILVSGAVITFISNHAYSEIITFGLFIIALTSLTGYLMQSNTHAYQLILYFSVISIFSILYFELLNFELLSTKLLLAQLLANTLAVTGIRLFQSLTFSGLLKVK
jgi:hypothetical protein